MENTSTITNLILRSVIAITVCVAFLIIIYAIFIRGVKGEFAIVSAVASLLLAIFTGLAAKNFIKADENKDAVKDEEVKPAIDEGNSSPTPKVS